MQPPKSILQQLQEAARKQQTMQQQQHEQSPNERSQTKQPQKHVIVRNTLTTLRQAIETDSKTEELDDVVDVESVARELERQIDDLLNDIGSMQLESKLNKITAKTIQQLGLKLCCIILVLNVQYIALEYCFIIVMILHHNINFFSQI